MEIKRGYVKWENENGFHKEPLYKHPELLRTATNEQKLEAEEVRRLNSDAEERLAVETVDSSEDVHETLLDLKAAPDYVLTAEDLDGRDYNDNGR